MAATVYILTIVKRFIGFKVGDVFAALDPAIGRKLKLSQTSAYRTLNSEPMRDGIPFV